MSAAQAMLASTTRMLRASWRDGFCRDLYADFNSLTLAITLEALFGARMAAGEDAAGRGITDAIREAFRFFAARGASALALPEWLPTPGNLRFAAAVARLDAAVLGLIAQRRRELAAAPRPPGDLLDSLLLAADEAGQGMGDRAARDEAMTLLVAGQETSAIVLGWACAYLAHHPEAQAAAAAEVAARVGARPLQAADAGRLPWVEAVVLEAMRLSPPAYLVGRCAAEATNLGGYHLPRGTTVLVSPHLLHRDPQHWGPDAAAFRPERWLELQRAQLEQGQPGTQQGVGGSQQPPAGCPHAAAAGNGGSGGGGGVSGGGELGGSGMAFLTGMGPHGAYIPFGAGQRNCIGTGEALRGECFALAGTAPHLKPAVGLEPLTHTDQPLLPPLALPAGFAMLEAVLVVASILQQYRLEPLPGAPFPAARPQITLRPDSVRLLLRRR
ncbi:hypothetical protein CHLNCDRAFT_51282 [Chlorella variabilis]|uniref:Cytochrome P450 n=1 Tax=Chlorella variabilis TaxID=554065 RepID=E1ZA56_CHLVA|nr:hypothetical protein CHLNCDRAFT_51282 [Chlorella variabilis]EFN57207.1 hypothetical protein CHLNCDRAFT_51282 [Chlorella variabilis]|eukprot:XP_005849309.1 hypothetical protein CHLNCDRAFT_51282 [Chlorella variabilis]